jgi:hypothetical protein
MTKFEKLVDDPFSYIIISLLMSMIGFIIGFVLGMI